MMRRSIQIATALVLSCGIAGFVACSKNDGAETVAKPPSLAASAPSRQGPVGGETGKAGERNTKGKDITKGLAGGPESDRRKIIRNGELRLTVESYEQARAQIDQLLSDVKGFVASSQVRHASERVSSATVVLRIPAHTYGDVVVRIAKLGIVAHESSKADDITEQYVDLSARLSNAKKLESRLLELLANQTGKITDVLQVERELSRVREEVERLEGKLRMWDGLVSLSTLTVHLETRVHYVAGKPLELGDQLSSDWDDSWRDFQRFGKGVLRGAVKMVPWLPLWAGGALLVWLLYRKLRRRFAAKK